jgi:dCMP deaminase
MNTPAKIEHSKWDVRFLSLARHISTWSKDPSTKVGAVIVDRDKRIISVGYNGFAQKTPDDKQILEDRDAKLNMIIHGEINAILFAKQSLVGTSLYTWPFLPCSRCAAIVIQVGITRVVAPVNEDPRWEESFKLSQKMFNEANVTVDLKDKSSVQSLDQLKDGDDSDKDYS